MKTAKILTTFALASMFVACVEDLTPAENIQQEMNDVVSGEVIGTDISMTIPASGVQTKYTGGIKGWDSEDKIGLGWLAQGDDIATDNKLYANHLFYVAEDEKFESRGNIYKGWHFAYFPYAYMESVGVLNLENLNPAQTGDVSNSTEYYKRLGQAFSVSALQYLTKESLVAPYYNELKPDVYFKPQRAVSILAITTNPVAESAFATDDILKAYEIESITVDLALPRFATEATLEPTKLHKYDTTKTQSVNDSLLVNSLKEAIVIANDKNLNKLTTDVSAVGYTVGSTARAMAFTLPCTRYVSFHPVKENVVITVSTNKGSFTIKYVNETTDTPEWQKANNAAIEALVAAYQKDGDMTLPGQHTLNLSLNLHENLFGVDWTVADEEGWMAKYDLADALRIEKPEFELIENADINMSEVTVPDGGVKVSGEGTLTIDADMTWNNKIELGEKINVVISANKTLTVDSELSPNSLTNNGIIATTANTVISNLINNGEVRVEYGAQVYPETNREGVISHVVDQLDIDKPVRIQNLIAAGTEPDNANKKFYANVNTLVVNKGFELDFNKNVTTSGTPADSDPYAPTPETPGSSQTQSPYGTELSKINFVINGGSIKSSDAEQNVNHVTMNGGNVGPNITLTSLTIEEGANTVAAKNINGNVHVKNGAGTIAASNITGRFTIEKGNYTVTAEKITGDVLAEGDNSFLGVKEFGANLTLTQTQNASTLNGNKVTGNVTLTGAFDVHKVSAKDMTISESVKLVEDCTISGNFTNNCNVMATGTTVSGNFNNEKAVASLENTTVAGILTVAKGSEVNISGKSTVGSIVNNGTLNSYVDLVVNNITLNPGSQTSLKESEESEYFDGTIWYNGTYYNKNMSLDGAVKKYESDAEMLKALINEAENGEVKLVKDLELTESLTFEAPATTKSNFEAKAITIDLNGNTLKATYVDDFIVNKGVNLTIKNGTIDVDGTAVYTTAGSTILDNCIVRTSHVSYDLIGVKNNSHIEIIGGSYTYTAEAPAKADRYVIGILNATAEISGATVNGGLSGGICVKGKSTVSVDGGKFTAGANYALFVRDFTTDGVTSTPVVTCTNLEAENVIGKVADFYCANDGSKLTVNGVTVTGIYDLK